MFLLLKRPRKVYPQPFFHLKARGEHMDLEKKFKNKYGEKEYESIFDAEFKQAVKDMDKIAGIISKPVSSKEGS